MIIDWGVLIKNLKSQDIFEQLIQKIFQEKSHLLSTIYWHLKKMHLLLLFYIHQKTKLAYTTDINTR